MAILIGQQVHAEVAANVAIASSAALQTVGLLVPIAANQKMKIRAWVKFSVGPTGGVRSLVAVPAGGTLLNVSTRLTDAVTPATIPSVVNTVFTNALAVAGTHWLEIEADIVNGATAGNVDVQLAQNTSDVLTLTVLRGGWLDVVKY
jgi:hypothetical protein